MRQVDRRLGLSGAAARALHDPRRKASCTHTVVTLRRQRLHALALAYEDLNDHQTLGHDAGLRRRRRALRHWPVRPPCVGWNRARRGRTRCACTRCCSTSSSRRSDVDQKRLILDFDATDVPLHGAQEGRFFHGYYDHYCYLPLYVFCGRHLLVAYLRRSDIDAAQLGDPRAAGEGAAPTVARHARLLALCEDLRGAAEKRFTATGSKQRLFGSVSYAAQTWDRSLRNMRPLHPGERRVIVKADRSAFGANPRFVVTNLPYRERYLYERVYCARGDMENRNKDQELDLFAMRTSRMSMAANQFRILLSGLVPWWCATRVASASC